MKVGVCSQAGVCGKWGLPGFANRYFRFWFQEKTERTTMKTALRGVFAAAALLVGTLAAPQPAFAQNFGFAATTGFTTSDVCKNSNSPASTCQVLTDGSPFQPSVVTGGVLRLTSANLNQHGAAWYYQPQMLSTGFTTAFQFRISNTNLCLFCTFPADGMALVIQNDPAGTGAIGYTGNGQNMAYGNNDVSTASGPGNAITNSLAIELDTYQNSNFSDPDGNHIAVQSMGVNCNRGTPIASGDGVSKLLRLPD